MSVTAHCPACRTAMVIPDVLAGQSVTCPNCHSVVHPTARPAPAVAYKDCPFCGEAVRVEAKKCKHCRETIDIALRTAEEARRLARRRSGPAQVFMNAGGAASSSSAAASSAAADSSSDSTAGKALGGCLVLSMMLFCCCGLPIYFGNDKSGPATSSESSPSAKSSPGSKSSAPPLSPPTRTEPIGSRD